MTNDSPKRDPREDAVFALGEIADNWWGDYSDFADCIPIGADRCRVAKNLRGFARAIDYRPRNWKTIAGMVAFAAMLVAITWTGGMLALSAAGCGAGLTMLALSRYL